MKSKVIGSVLAVAGLLLSANAGFAHHGDAGRYEDYVITVSGTVVALLLVNPHTVVVFDVDNQETGEVVTWRIEAGSPRQLIRNFGWNKDTLQPGTRITVTGRPTRSGEPYINLTELNSTIVMAETGEEIYRSSH